MKDFVDAFTTLVSDSGLPPFVISGSGASGYWRQLTLREFQSKLVVAVFVNPTYLADKTTTDTFSDKTTTDVSDKTTTEPVCDKRTTDTVSDMTVTDHDKDKTVTDDVTDKTEEAPSTNASDKVAAIRQSVVTLCESRGEVASLLWVDLRNTSDTPDYQLLAGDASVEEVLLGKRFRVSPGAFFQTISAAAEALYTLIGDKVAESPNAVLADICCGTGTIGLLLASRVKFVLGLELVAEAVEDAKHNRGLNGIENARFIQGRAEDSFSNFGHLLPAECKESEVIGILDPPRAGLNSKIIAAIRRMDRLQRLLYVSCDPKQARQNFADLCRPMSNKYLGSPFSLTEITPVDMFPNTRHFEWLLVFER